MKKEGKSITDKRNSMCKYPEMEGNLAYFRTDNRFVCGWKTDGRGNTVKEKLGWSTGARTCRPQSRSW